MTHLDALQCKYDGPIPEAERDTAEVADRATPHSAPAACTVRVKSYKPEAIVADMARIMVEAAQERDGCTRDDLVRAGYPDAVIDQFAGIALVRAESILAASDAGDAA